MPAPAQIRVLAPRLRIPAISVDALVEPVGLTNVGAMGAPKGPVNVGWYNRSVIPGTPGTAVMDGHFGWKQGMPAVFDKLHEIRVGDRIYYDDAEGVTTVFVVRELQTLGEHDIVRQVFHASDGKAHVNLITCKGIWNKSQKSYSKRLVVFADKVRGE